MKKQIIGKIGFFSALSISVSSVIGIGIFFKNISILKNQIIETKDGIDYFSLYSFLAIWIFGALLALLTAYCFIQVSKQKYSKSGLTGWIEALSSKERSFFIKILHSFLYYGILFAVLPILSTEMIFMAIASIHGVDVKQIHFGYVLATSVFVGIFILTMNFLSLKTVVWMQQFSFFFKIIPLLIAVIIAFIGSYKTPTVNTNTLNLGAMGVATTNSFNWSGFFLSLPIVLFAFDSFLAIGNLADDMKKPKQISLVSVVTIIISAVVYFLISLGVALTGYANLVYIFSILFTKEQETTRKVISVIVYFMLGISGYFVCNSVSLATLRSFQGLVEEKNVIGDKFWAKLNAKKDGLGGFVLTLLVKLVYLAIFGTISLILGGDSLLDTITNLPITIFFLVYAYAIFLTLKKEWKNQKTNIRFFRTIGIITITLIVSILIFDIIYRDIYLAFIANGNSSSGIFYSISEWKYLYDGIAFWLILILSIAFAWINYWFAFKKNKIKAN